MNGSPLNIFDLTGGKFNLLSGDALSGIGSPSADGLAEAPAGFDELFNSLIGNVEPGNIEALKNLVGNNNQPTMVPFNNLLGETVVNSEVQTFGKFGNVVENIETTKTGLVSNELIDTKVAENITAFNEELEALNLKSNNGLTENVKQLLNNKTVELENGQYKVVNSEVADGKLNLEVQSNEDAKQTIKINIPLEMLKDGLKQQTEQSPVRVDLNGGANETVKLEQLFTRLNVKEIDIKTVKSEEEVSVNKENKVEIKISAEDKGREVAIKGKLNKHDVKAEVVNKSTANTLSKIKFNVTDNSVVAGKDAAVESVERKAAPKANPQLNNVIADQFKSVAPNVVRQQAQVSPKAKNQNIGKAAVIDDNDTWSREPFDLLGIKKPQANNNVKPVNNTFAKMNMANDSNTFGTQTLESTQADKAGNLFSFDKLDFDLKVENKEVKTHPVRFNMPENFKSQFKMNGQSITLKIDPEHLGPARLNLSLNHENKLRAKLFVATPEAKMILENSIEKLIDQLAKADIKVDLLEISVGSDGAREEMFNRQAQWQRRQNMKNLNLDDNQIEEQTAKVSPQYIRPVGHVNSSGVNMLA